MGIRVQQCRLQTARAEDLSQPCARHRLPSLRALQNDEDLRCRNSWSLEPRVLLDDAEQERWRWHRPLLSTLPSHPQAAVLEVDVGAAQIQHLLASQPVEQHQVRDGEVSVAAKAVEQLVHLVDRQRFDDGPRLLHAHDSAAANGVACTELRRLSRPALRKPSQSDKSLGCETAAGVRQIQVAGQSGGIPVACGPPARANWAPKNLNLAEPAGRSFAERMLNRPRWPL